MNSRTICVVTGTRADYGLLYWLLRDIQDASALTLQLLVTGMHLAPEFGETYRTIEEDGFPIDAKVEMLLSSDTAVGTAKSMGLGVIGCADAFARLQPDLIVLLGDRFEMFAAAQAGLVMRIPLAHIHGGETTAGAFDEGLRHAITKMAHLHFASAEPHQRRIIQMGEAPDRVFTVGAPGLDHLRRLDVMNREPLETSIDLSLDSPSFLVTLHPATLSEQPARETAQALLDALDRFPEAHILFTKTNADPEGRVINRMIEDYATQHPERMRVFTSLGQRRYLSALHQVDVVIGNSSSGLLEAPAIPVPTVNIGIRQQGRLSARSVIDCEATAAGIAEAIEQALDPAFDDVLRETTSPYGDGYASERILKQLKTVPLDASMLAKAFYDLPEQAFTSIS